MHDIHDFTSLESTLQHSELFLSKSYVLEPVHTFIALPGYCTYLANCQVLLCAMLGASKFYEYLTDYISVPDIIPSTSMFLNFIFTTTLEVGSAIPFCTKWNRLRSQTSETQVQHHESDKDSRECIPNMLCLMNTERSSFK